MIFFNLGCLLSTDPNIEHKEFLSYSPPTFRRMFFDTLFSVKQRVKRNDSTPCLLTIILYVSCLNKWYVFTARCKSSGSWSGRHDDNQLELSRDFMPKGHLWWFLGWHVMCHIKIYWIHTKNLDVTGKILKRMLKSWKSTDTFYRKPKYFIVNSIFQYRHR